MTRYRHLSAACSVGKRPLAPTARRYRELRDSLVILSDWLGWRLDLRFFVLDVSGTRGFGGVSGLVVRVGFRVGLGRVVRAGR